jgi:poly-gamma-glutamate capsule biosynthesis protein CapA/YwtB (metallophosphatase superfamily)
MSLYHPNSDVPMDTFAQLVKLLVSDPDGVKERLEALQDAKAAHDEAARVAASTRAAAEEAMAKAQATLDNADARTHALDMREAAVREAEEQIAQREEEADILSAQAQAVLAVRRKRK